MEVREGVFGKKSVCLEPARCFEGRCGTGFELLGGGFLENLRRGPNHLNIFEKSRAQYACIHCNVLAMENMGEKEGIGEKETRGGNETGGGNETMGEKEVLVL